ncbi:capsule biosynthesis GfcC family protein [Isoptericola jiangsuensis]|uniref:capsule biosynthesis GfcC family protein n=1 Tax=Isoptericola jiangsuensis TaxID=548579 RepID=UPI003865EE14
MRFSTTFAALLCLGYSLSAKSQASEPVVAFEGELESEQPSVVAADGRLASAILAAKPSSRAFLPATIFTRDAAVARQVRLKAGIEHDLQQLKKHSDPAISLVAERLEEWIADLPVTGRTAVLADARLMELQPQHNPRVETGDAVRFLPRPATVEVVGAVASHCTLEHVPQLDALEYVKKCHATSSADPDHIFVIQVDGTIQALGIALWNRSDTQYVSPGGRILVPLDRRRTGRIAPDIDQDLSRFIATQLPSP